MSKQWDDKIKRIFSTAPQDFVSWLLPGARFVRKLPLELKTLTRTITADTLYEMVVNKENAILHVEFQKKIDPGMGLRVWEYNVQTTIEHQCPVYSFVIYLVPGGTVPSSEITWGLTGYPRVHKFGYTNVEMWKIPVNEIKQTGLKGVFPLCVLAQGGQRRDEMDDVFDKLANQREMLSLAFMLASMVFQSDSDLQWLKRRKTMLDDILRDTWVYQEIREEGLEEGRQEGRQEGREEEKREELQRQRQLLTITVSIHFPDVLSLAQRCGEAIHEPDELQQLIMNVLTAANVDVARQHLLSVAHNKHIDVQ